MKTLSQTYNSTKELKYHLQKRSKWWWIVSVDSDGNRDGIDGHQSKAITRDMAKQWGLKLEKDDLPQSD